MTPDDISGHSAGSDTVRKVAPPKAPRRMVGPESEVRGGSEAPDKTLDESAADEAIADASAGTARGKRGAA